MADRMDNVRPRTTRVGKLRWVIREPCPGRLREVLSDPDRFLQDPALLISNTELITLGKMLPAAPGEPTLLLRRLNYGRLRHRLRDVFRPTRAERAFWRGLDLEQAGVRSPRNLAVGFERMLRWPRRAYLVTEWLAGAVSLKEWLKQHGSVSRAQLQELADLLARLHEHHFSHRDLNATNILFDAQQQPWLIDLDGVRCIDRFNEKDAAADLSRFAWEFVGYPRFMKWNARRFLKRYCARRRLEEALPRLEEQIARPLLRRISAGITRWK